MMDMFIRVLMYKNENPEVAFFGLVGFFHKCMEEIE